MHLAPSVGRINVCIRGLKYVLLNYEHKNSPGDKAVSMLFCTHTKTHTSVIEDANLIPVISQDGLFGSDPLKMTTV